MYAAQSVPIGNSKLFTSVVAGSFLAISLTFSSTYSPAHAEKLYSKVTKEEAAELSGPLKTFICLGERLVPSWCEDYLDFKLKAKVRVEEVASKTDAPSGPLTYLQEIENQPDFLIPLRMLLTKLLKQPKHLLRRKQPARKSGMLFWTTAISPV